MTKRLKKCFISRKLFAFLFVFILLELKVCYRAYDFETNLQIFVQVTLDMCVPR